MALITRRRFIQASAAVATTGALAIGIDASVFEPNDPALVRVEIALARLPKAFDGFTIAQLSDFHYDEVFSVVPVRKAIQVVNKLQPDLIALTGDYVTVPLLDDFLSTKAGKVHRAKEAIATAPPCARLLGELRAPSGVVAILGNHDAISDPEFISDHLEQQKISVLRNGSLAIEAGGSRLWLAGIDDITEGNPDLNLTLAKVPQNEATILLCHEPDFADQVVDRSVDLMLSGHSHGGQIWLPMIGAPWLPLYGRKYPRGRYQLGRLTLYTNIGLGTIRAPVRLNCVPEVTLFTLRAKA